MPEALLDVTYFRSFLLYNVGNYQTKARAAYRSNPGHPDTYKPGVVYTKVYNYTKKLFSAIFSNYRLFKSGAYLLLAFNKSLISKLASLY